MRTRHRIPTVFNLYMVDVLCCSLGCAIMLWLLNLHDAKELGERAGQTRALLADTQGRLDDATRQAEVLGKDLTATRVQASDLRDDLENRKALLADSEERLARKTKEQQKLAASLEAERKRMETLQTLLREKEKLAQSASRNVEVLTDRLLDADARNQGLKAVADLVPGLREDLQHSRTQLSAAGEQVAALSKDLELRKKALADNSRNLRALDESRSALRLERDSRGQQLADALQTLDLLRSEKKQLSEQVVRAREAADHRFAGIALTGRNVVFLVDMSGSMELLDDQTTAPDKWAGIRETLVKVMRSLPELERYQLILFSDKATYPLGQDGRWLDYDAQTAGDRVARALAAIKPKGNTNMHAAFEEAFRLRAAGLDTIYLFSDGLPNIGAGLTAEAARTLKETEKAAVLGQVVRKALKSDWNRSQPGRPRVRINTIGFFYESPDVGAFLWALAREHEGSFVGMSKP